MPAVSIVLGLPPLIFIWVAVSGTCFTATRIFMPKHPGSCPVVLEFPRDPEPVARDEDAIEDDRRSRVAVGDALGLEGRHAGVAAELAGLAAAQTHGGHRLAGPRDRDAELELQGLPPRRRH